MIVFQAIKSAIDSDNSAMKTREYITFTNTFGTHFVKRTDMGASITFRRVFEVIAFDIYLVKTNSFPYYKSLEAPQRRILKSVQSVCLLLLVDAWALLLPEKKSFLPLERLASTQTLAGAKRTSIPIRYNNIFGS